MKMLSSVTAVALALVTALVAVLVPVTAGVYADDNEWDEYPLPEVGQQGDWVLTGDVGSEVSGVTAVAAAYDGTIYAATEESDGSPLDGYNLFTSTDEGYTWDPLWKIPGSDGGTEIITVVLPRPQDADLVYIATRYNVYKSTDGGHHFRSLGCPEGQSGQITSLAVAEYDGSYLVAVGTRDTDGSEFGGAYMRDESQPFSSWTDLRVGEVAAGTTYDVLAVAFSPGFEDDEQVIAVITDESNTVVTTKMGSAGWGADIGDAALLNPLTSSAWAGTGASIAFPANYDSDVDEELYIQYVGLDVDGANGGLYLVAGREVPNSSLAAPVYFGTPVHSVAAAGEAFPLDVDIGGGFDPAVASQVFTPAAVVAGLTNGGAVSFATGVAYMPPAAAPAQETSVAIGQYHGSGYFVYAGTTGIGGGFARSADNGANFARTGLICDDRTQALDFAVSPEYGDDGTLYVITEGHSGDSILWRTTYRGDSWDAVLTEGQLITNTNGDTKTVGDFDQVALSRKFATDSAVFVLETGSAPDIWRSTDNGQRFWALRSTATSNVVDHWAIAGIKKVFIGDDAGGFYQTDNGGTTWQLTETGLSGFSDMVLSPDFESDETILAADGNGDIKISTDSGDHWDNIDEEFPGSGQTFLAFDYDYAESGVFFAGAGTVVERFGADGEGWEDISDVTAPPGQDLGASGNITGLVIAPDDALYVSTDNDSGLFRALSGTGPLNTTYWEQVDKDGPTELCSLMLTSGSNVLMGHYGADVYEYTDILTGPVVLTSPSDGAAVEDLDRVTLTWEKMDGAKTYQVDVDTDPGFKGQRIVA